MDPAFDDVRFLAGSSNRVDVLGALMSGPMTRDGLLAQVEASRVTCQRILAELKERGWIRYQEPEYAATAVGRTIFREFEQFLDTVRATRRLDDVMPWLPIEAFDFSIGRLAEARVTIPNDTHYAATIRRVDELIRGASESMVLSHGVSSSTVAATRDAVVEHGQHFEIVLPEYTISYIEADAPLLETFSELVEAEGATVYVTPNSPPEMMVALLDDVAVLGLLGDGLPRGVIESEDGVVCKWARDTFEQWRADATVLEP